MLIFQFYENSDRVISVGDGKVVSSSPARTVAASNVRRKQAVRQTLGI